MSAKTLSIATIFSLVALSLFIFSRCNNKLEYWSANYIGPGIFNAVISGRSDLVNEYLKTGSDPNALDRKGKPLLSYAAIAGHEEIVQLLISHGAKPNISYDFDGRTALGEAVSRGLLQVTVVLLKNGANPEKGNRGGSGIPLMKAAACGYVDIVTELISAGSQVNSKDMFGKTAIKYAELSLSDNHVVELLLQEAIEFKGLYHDKRPQTLEEVKGNLKKTIELLREAGATK
jgi:ankyrin repeat protein